MSATLLKSADLKLVFDSKINILVNRVFTHYPRKESPTMTKVSEVKVKQFNGVKSKIDYVKTFSKRMLKTQIFIGTYQEKRYVQSLNSYRDVIKICPKESQFIENVMSVKKKVNRELSDEFDWVGITSPEMIGAPVGHCLWATLPVEVFGTYWFKIRSVDFKNKEVKVKLEVVRPIESERSATEASEGEESVDLKTTIQDISQNLKVSLFDWLKTYVTLTNTKQAVVFLALLVGTMLAGGVNAVKFLLEYLLKFMRETSGLVTACTPMVIAGLDLTRKVIFGLFSLIAFLIHGKSRPPPPAVYYHSSPNAIQYMAPLRQRALPYRSSVTITPMDD